MPQLDFHPAPGIGPMLPGWTLPPYFPQAPSSDMVASIGAALPGRAIRIPRIGEIMATPGQPLPQNPLLAALGRGTGDLTSGAYPIPWNPIAGGMSGVHDLTPGSYPEPWNPITGRLSGLGCSSCNGMGDVVTDSVSGWLNQDSPISGVSNLLFWGGAAVAIFAFSEFKGSKYSYSSGHRKNPAHSKSLPFFRPRRRRNESVEQGYYDSGGRFHPIRASDDYDPEAVGERYQYARQKPAKKRRARR